MSRRAGRLWESAQAGSSEHDSLGYEFGTFTDRFEKLEEALKIVIPMLNGEKVSLDGKHYQVSDAINSHCLSDSDHDRWEWENVDGRAVCR